MVNWHFLAGVIFHNTQGSEHDVEAQITKLSKREGFDEQAFRKGWAATLADVKADANTWATLGNAQGNMEPD